MYDLKNDLWEIENKIDHPDCRERLLDLRQALYKWLDESDDELKQDYGMIVPEAKVEPAKKSAVPVLPAVDDLARMSIQRTPMENTPYLVTVPVSEGNRPAIDSTRCHDRSGEQRRLFPHNICD